MGDSEYAFIYIEKKKRSLWLLCRDQAENGSKEQNKEAHECEFQRSRQEMMSFG